jgi:diadenosine tetraphosphatase ApaH/serine/threonine PP2A family protein phosphatase
MRAVLDAAGAHGGYDEVWCLGDVVGYGPDPSECISFVREKCSLCVAGNHDLAVAGVIGTEDFNEDAAQAVLWSRAQLTPGEKDYLAGLPLRVEHGRFTLVHGSLRDPVWEYVWSPQGAEGSLAVLNTGFCLVGHTHIPALYAEGGKGAGVEELAVLENAALGDRRCLLNPGAVGQPRDGDPRASFVIIDTEARTFSLLRTPYDVRGVQNRMRERGLPGRLIERLPLGR